MIITLLPTEEYLNKCYDGFSDDVYNIDDQSIMIQNESDTIDVDYNEEFTIPEGFEGELPDDDFFYLSKYYDDRIDRNLLSGKYKITKGNSEYGEPINIVKRLSSGPAIDLLPHWIIIG